MFNHNILFTVLKFKTKKKSQHTVYTCFVTAGNATVSQMVCRACSRQPLATRLIFFRDYCSGGQLFGIITGETLNSLVPGTEIKKTQELILQPFDTTRPGNNPFPPKFRNAFLEEGSQLWLKTHYDAQLESFNFAQKNTLTANFPLIKLPFKSLTKQKCCLQRHAVADVFER